ncbi:MAG: CotH kinase family protein, partial [Sulfurimonas sp.]|nr:CotH kinase family protein [Sulfurimonas sp.]
MKFFSVYALSLLLIVGCGSYNDKNDGEPSFRGAIVDKDSWYEDANNDVIVMNIINPIPNEYECQPADNLTLVPRPCTIEDVNLDIDPADSYEPTLHVQMSTNSFIPSSNLMNATLKIKGNYSRTLDQKSYSLKLDSKTNLFMKQRKFGLTKSQSDTSRTKNKLAFDLFRIIPNITSLKVQFIDLKINNVDYGLFHHVETIRKEYLINRGWNEDDKLYNTVNFYFKEHEELALTASGEPVNEARFKEILEIRTGDEHLVLAEMLRAIAVTTNIDDVIAKYFNRDNYMTWLAINLILNNKDTVQQNFYL